MSIQLKNLLVTVKPPDHFRRKVLSAWNKRKHEDKVAKETIQIGLVAFFAVVAGLALMFAGRRSNAA
jgi:hypothetical protein